MPSFSFTTETDDSAPGIVPLAPNNGQTGVLVSTTIQIRFTDEVMVDAATIQIVVNSTPYVVTGVAQNGATFNAVSNDFNGVDGTLTLPDILPEATVVLVTATAADTTANVAQISYTFSTAVGVRLLSVENVSEGILIARFNEPVALDDSFFDPSNWIITTITPDASDITIDAVLSDSASPNVATLQISGGGSTYQLSVTNLTSVSGTSLDALDPVSFDIVFDEQPEPTVRIFSSVFGPIVISHRRLTRRTIEQHTADRAIATGSKKQFDQKFASIDDGRTTRSGQDGARRT